MLTLTLREVIRSCVEDEEEDVEAMLARSKYSLVKPSSVELTALVEKINRVVSHHENVYFHIYRETYRDMTTTSN